MICNYPIISPSSIISYTWHVLLWLINSSLIANDCRRSTNPLYTRSIFDNMAGLMYNGSRNNALVHFQYVVPTIRCWPIYMHIISSVAAFLYQ